MHPCVADTESPAIGPYTQMPFYRGAADGGEKKRNRLVCVFAPWRDTIFARLNFPHVPSAGTGFAVTPYLVGLAAVDSGPASPAFERCPQILDPHRLGNVIVHARFEACFPVSLHGVARH